MFKKKYHGGLKLSLSLLFIMLLSMCSTCYASTTISQNEGEYIFKYLFTNHYINETITNLNGSTSNTTFSRISENNTYISDFITWFNNNNTLDISENTTFFYYRQINSTNGQILYGNYNNSKPGNSELPFLYIYFNNSSSLNFYAIDDSNQLLRHEIRAFDVTTTSNGFTYSSMRTTYTGTSLQASFYWRNKNIYWNSDYFANNAIMEKIPGVVSFSSTNAIYVNYNGRDFYNVPETRQLLTEYDDSYIPSEPDTSSSGDNQEIINTINDNTDRIIINNNINTDDIINSQNDNTDRIIDNQNENTEEIVSAINNSNENYWGSDEDLDGKDQEDFISNSVNSLVADVSGELHQNAVFQHLDTAENTFLDFFRNKQDESYYDLIISWDAISPVITMFDGSVTISDGQSIIAGDSINISQLCRENEQLGKIQQYIRIIFNFSCLIALLWQIYNLVLSTLGIDNPYLYEDADVVDAVNVDTGEVRTSYRTRKRIYKKR